MAPTTGGTERIGFMKILTFVMVGTLIAGIPTGFLGIGSGVLLMPAIAYLYGMREGSEHGTSLLVASVTAIVGALAYRAQFHSAWLEYHGWLSSVLLIAGTMAGAAAGGKIGRSPWMTRTRAYWTSLLVAVGALVLAIGSGLLGRWSAPIPGSEWGMAVVGIAAGFASGVFAVGGGVLTVVALTLLMGIPQGMAHGLSLVVVSVASLLGAAIHAARGNVRGSAAFWMSVGGVMGTLMGVRLAADIGGPALEASFGGFLVLYAAIRAARQGRAAARTE